MSDVPETEPPTVGATPGAEPEGEQVMDLLAGHVPLALLVDLITPEGPASADILRTEGMPDDAWWEPEGDAPDADDAGTRAPDPAP